MQRQRIALAQQAARRTRISPRSSVVVTRHQPHGAGAANQDRRQLISPAAPTALLRLKPSRRVGGDGLRYRRNIRARYSISDSGFRVHRCGTRAKLSAERPDLQFERNRCRNGYANWRMPRENEVGV